MIDFFTDPILRGPTWGCIFMCIASSLMGVVIFLRKRSLLSESLSHASYPGACLGIALFALIFPQYEEWAFLAILCGALFSSWLGLKAIEFLCKKASVQTDAALCFVLAVFFGFGLVIASTMQIHLPMWHKQVQMLLLGQAATMGDLHILIYGILASFVALFLFLTYRPLAAFLFDPDFCKVARVRVQLLDRVTFWLLLFSLVIGIRSVGVVLMSAMAIGPAVAARAWTDRLGSMFFLAAAVGALSAFAGNYCSFAFDLPTGPAIVLVSTAGALASLLFAPKRGLVFRMMRIGRFRLRTVEENLLKGMWKRGVAPKAATWIESFALLRLKKAGWVGSEGALTVDGMLKAASIVRLHRLWELYLTESLGMAVEKVHQTAEEMEHILTPEMEERLTRLLENPKTDPHQQPIPEKSV